MKGKSQLQMSVLRLCRDAFKFAYKQPQPVKTQLSNYIKTQFQQHRNISRIKFHQIQYRLRNGKNRLKMLKDCGTIDGIKLK